MHPSTQSMTEKDLQRNHTDSFSRSLFRVAWMFHMASLFLPAIPNGWTSAEPGSVLQGWQVLGEVSLGWMLSPYVLPYFYANLMFVLSIWRCFRNQPRDAVSAFYLANLLIATAIAWHAHRMVESVYIGYYLWALSLTFLLFAFAVPCSSPEN